MRLINADELRDIYSGVPNGVYTTGHFITAIDECETVDAIPIEPLAVWLAGYHVSPPEYALKETGALDPIDQASTVFTPHQIATAWAYHLRKLMESGLMG